MADPKLTEYIMDCRSKGFSQEQIFQVLVSNGYDNNDASAAVKYVFSEATDTSNQASAASLQAKNIANPLSLSKNKLLIIGVLITIILFGIIISLNVGKEPGSISISKKSGSSLTLNQGQDVKDNAPGSEKTINDLCSIVSCEKNKKCVKGECILLSCIDMNGKICNDREECSSEGIISDDIKKCCLSECIAKETDISGCGSIDCPQTHICDNGVCLLKDCAGLGGEICQAPRTCMNSTTVSNDSEACCLGGCIETDACKDITCSANEVCNEGICELQSCLEVGGKTCDINEFCSGTTSATSDSDDCCTGDCVASNPCSGVTCQSNKVCVSGVCQLKTCAGQNGNICSSSQSCSGSAALSSDSDNCCLGSCVTSNPCSGVTCPSNKVCVSGVCQLKTCSEQNGDICSAAETCSSLISASDSDKCCAATCQSPSSVKSFTMTATRFSFSPQALQVNLGDTVKISLTSLDGNHGIVIPQFDVDVFVDEGQTKEVQFIADSAGTFQFFCNVFCGSGHGDMKGTIQVS